MLKIQMENLILWRERNNSCDIMFELTMGPIIFILIIMPPRELKFVGPTIGNDLLHQ
jgi:hypothetical protein